MNTTSTAEKTHVIPASAEPVSTRGRQAYRALCGELVYGDEHSATPTCLDCQRLDAEDTAAIESLKAEDVSAIPPLAHLADVMDLGFELGRGNQAGVADLLARFRKRR